MKSSRTRSREAEKPAPGKLGTGSQKWDNFQKWKIAGNA